MTRPSAPAPAGDDTALEWKVRIFVVGAVLAMGGIYMDERWLVGLATVVLLGGVVLRFLPRLAIRGDGEPRAGIPEDAVSGENRPERSAPRSDSDADSDGRS